MSRNRRGSVFTPRWRQTRLGKPRKFSPESKVAYLNRVIKRANKAAGYDTAKKPYEWGFYFEGKADVVVAFTRSEARASIKKVLGINKKHRLPVEVEITKGDRVE